MSNSDFKIRRYRGVLVASVLMFITYSLLFTSCANMGSPTGGLKDSIPPVIVNMDPMPGELNFKGKDIFFEFNEYIVHEDITSKLVISPPVEKRPTVRMKGKGFILRFEEPLADSTTYSVDLKNSVVDNNEGNVYENLRFTFSTGNKLDTFRLAGLVKDAFTLEPMDGATILLYKNITDSLPEKGYPDYMAKTNDEGVFLVEGLSEGNYKIFSVVDSDNDKKIGLKSEKYAFIDEFITPTATFIPGNDTLVRESDTLLVYGHVRYGPDPLFMLMYEEENYTPGIKEYGRTSAKEMYLSLYESITDSFSISVIDTLGTLNSDLHIESELEQDSLLLWFVDTNFVNQEEVLLQVDFVALDSLNQRVIKRDTLEMYFKEVVVEKKKERGKRKTEEKIEVNKTMTLSLSVSTGADIFSDVILSSISPLAKMDTSAVKLYQVVDTLEVEKSRSIEMKERYQRSYKISSDWEYGAVYKLVVDSAAATSVYGVGSALFENEFSFKDIEEYGTINMILSGVSGPTIIQILSASDESVIREKVTDKDGSVLFIDLPPSKYMVKAIFDINNSGEWDSGKYSKNQMPEGVMYYPEVIKVRENWDNDKVWNLPEVIEYYKEILDPEKEKEKAKEEKRRKRENMKV